MGFEILKALVLKMVQALPNIVGAVFIFIVGYIVSQFVFKVLERVLVALKIDRAGEKLDEVEVFQRMNIQIKLSTILARFVYYVLLLTFLVAASDLLGMAVVSEQIAKIITYLPKLISALGVLLVGVWLANAVKVGLTAALQSLRIPSAGLLGNLVFYFLFVTFALSAMAQADINTTFLTSNLTLILSGVVAAFAIGYGFASRDLMANLLGGVYTRNRFNVGDVIKLGEMRGKIIDIDATSVTLQNETCQIVIPLSRLSSEPVEKYIE